MNNLDSKSIEGIMYMPGVKMCNIVFNSTALIFFIISALFFLLIFLDNSKKSDLIKTLILLCIKSLVFGLLAVYAVSALIIFFNFYVDIFSIIYNNFNQSISVPLNSKNKYLFALFVISASLLFLSLIYLKRNVFLAYTQRKHIAPNTSEILTLESVGRNGVGTTTYKGKKWLVYSFDCHLDCNKQYRLTKLSKSFLFVTNKPRIGDIITINNKKIIENEVIMYLSENWFISCEDEPLRFGCQYKIISFSIENSGYGVLASLPRRYLFVEKVNV